MSQRSDLCNTCLSRLQSRPLQWIIHSPSCLPRSPAHSSRRILSIAFTNIEQNEFRNDGRFSCSLVNSIARLFVRWLSCSLLFTEKESQKKGLHFNSFYWASIEVFLLKNIPFPPPGLPTPIDPVRGVIEPQTFHQLINIISSFLLLLLMFVSLNMGTCKL